MDLEYNNATSSETSELDASYLTELLQKLSIPAVVILIILMVTIITACLLHRKRKRTKVPDQRVLRPRSPVILDRESNVSCDVTKRLFKDNPNDGQSPDYEFRERNIENHIDENAIETFNNSGRRTLLRQVPSYWG